MERSKWKSATKDSLKTAYENRGKYVDGNNRRYIFNSVGAEKLWKVLDKSHKIRLLPVHPSDNINFYGMTVHIHTNVGVNQDQFLCLKRMKNTNCPICEQQTSLWDTEPDMAKDLYPQTRYLVWMVDLSQTPDKQVAQIWSCPRTAMDDILAVSYKKSTDEILNLADIDDGIAIYFDREKTPGTNFSKYKNFQLDDNTTPAKDEWLEEVCSFEELLDYATYEEINNAFLGISNEDSPKESVSPLGETVKTEVKKEVVEESAKEEVETTFISIDDMDREQLEALALSILSEDYEETEIADMGTKKLRRLVKEGALTTSKKEETPSVEDPVEDPKEALKKKLRERVSN